MYCNYNVYGRKLVQMDGFRKSVLNKVINLISENQKNIEYLNCFAFERDSKLRC